MREPNNGGNNKQPSFSPLLFVIPAEGGGDELSPWMAGSSAEQDARAEQWSEAGIQLKYASGFAGLIRFGGEAAPRP